VLDPGVALLLFVAEQLHGALGGDPDESGAGVVEADAKQVSRPPGRECLFDSTPAGPGLLTVGADNPVASG
jgi:hypothetical protein